MIRVSLVGILIGLYMTLIYTAYLIGYRFHELGHSVAEIKQWLNF